MDAEAAVEIERHAREVCDQQARITITPTRVRFDDDRAGRLPRSLQDHLDRDQP